MKSLSSLFGFIANASANQLKAYYVGHLDQNIQKLMAAGAADINMPAIALPDWFVPLCAVIAGIASLVKTLKVIAKIFRRKN